MSTPFIDNVDDAINDFSEDLLKRSPFVDRLAAILRTAPVQSSNVFAVYGEWGAGKTSVKNLLMKRFSRQKGNDVSTPEIIEFNPWAFSTQGELFNSFFSETSRALGRKDIGEVAVGLARLGTYFSIGATATKSLQTLADLALIPGGGLLGLATEALKSSAEHASLYSEHLKTGKIDALEDVRAALVRALKKLDRPILIIIDDVDRLPPEQILQIFQLIRVNASLPKINFLLLMDQSSIVTALKTKGYPEDYLEKIVQFALHLPAISETDLKEFLKTGLQQTLGSSASAFDWERWNELHRAALADFLDTPRKIRRILQTFRFHLSIFVSDNDPEVDLVDLFAVEVLRLYAPAVWEGLPRLYIPIFDQYSVADFLTHEEKSETQLTRQVNSLVDLVLPEQKESCRRLLGELLPQIKQSGGDANAVEHLRTCRLCTEIHFFSYFLLTTNAAYPTQKELGTLKAALVDGPAMLTKLRSWVKKYSYRSVLTKLESVARDVVDPAIIRNFLAVLWRLAEEDAASYPLEIDIPNDFVTETFTSSLILQITDESARFDIVREAFHQSKAVYPLFRYASYCIYTLREHPYRSTEIPFRAEVLASIQQECMSAVRTLIDRDRLIHHPRLGHLLSLWGNLEGDEPVRTWKSTVDDTDTTLLKLFLGLFGSSTGSGVMGGKLRTTTNYFISRKSLEQLFVLDQKFKERVEQIDRSSLSDHQHHAIREVLRNIEQKEKGIVDIRYGVPE